MKGIVKISDIDGNKMLKWIELRQKIYEKLLDEADLEFGVLEYCNNDKVDLRGKFTAKQLRTIAKYISLFENAYLKIWKI